jgi:FUN14 domain-containing protein 1
MKVGKSVAFAVGGGIILLQIANHEGYIKVNWDKIHKQVDKVEEKATGQSPKWMEKVRALIYISFSACICMLCILNFP